MSQGQKQQQAIKKMGSNCQLIYNASHQTHVLHMGSTARGLFVMYNGMDN